MDFEDFSLLISFLKRNYSSNPLFFQTSKFNLLIDLLEAKNTNLLSLRSSIRGSLITYNALQKVFKARFEDSRSLTGLNFISNLRTAQPFISSYRPLYENFFKKSQNNFTELVFFQKKLIQSFGITNYLKSSLNFTFFNFPFLLGTKSDMGRYI